MINPPSTDKSTLLRICATAAAAILVGMAAISSQSLWMDEGGTVFRAMMPNFEEWWKMLLQLRGSEVQMPAYMFLVWLWFHAGALSEFALRAINLPWLLITVLALGRVRFWPLVCLCSPFVLYYTGELRPYAMQIAAGALAAAALGKVMSNRDSDGFEGLHALCFSCLLLLLGSLTGAVWAAGVGLAAIVARPEWLSRGKFWLKAAPWMLSAAAVGAYYGFTLLEGYRAIQVQDPGVMSVFFGFYEMAGLLGLGPGRNELRGSIAAIMPWLWVLIPAAVCISLSWLLGFRMWMRSVPPRCVAAAACAVVLPVLALTVIGIIQEFRVLGRHMSPAMPAVLLPLAAALSASGKRRWICVVPAIMALLFMAWSSFNLRFLKRHERDDFKQATSLAIAALSEGKRVLWQADMNCARYYAYRSGGNRMIHLIQEFESDSPTSPMFADIIFINRPDSIYRGTNHHAMLKQHFFRLEREFAGFEVWVSE